MISFCKKKHRSLERERDLQPCLQLYRTIDTTADAAGSNIAIDVRSARKAGHIVIFTITTGTITPFNPVSIQMKKSLFIHLMASSLYIDVVYMQTCSLVVSNSWTTFFFLALIVVVDFLIHFQGIFKQHRYSFSLFIGTVTAEVLLLVDAALSSWAILIYIKATVLKKNKTIKNSNIK